ncbi:hypothetical protein NDN08_005899 [Rhodosorus marinus]|uniref:Uncharacterized protein n=1 Tax=Rhodosorus marinus TaxID=101924 RepID=A0AAV8V566_9RHOD|nr:hypothetical protein NDN08_005899 [Rhodosorus marinus]
MEWEWPEEDKQLLQQLQRKQIPDPGGKHARQDDSGVDLDFVSPGEYEQAFKRDMLASTALSHALRRIKAKTAGAAVPKLFRQRQDANSKDVGEKAAGKSRVTLQELNDHSKQEPLADREESTPDAIALHEAATQENNDRDERGPDYDKPVNQRTPVMQWSISRRGGPGPKKKQSQAGPFLQQALEDVPITSEKEEDPGEEAEETPEISIASLPGPTASASPENSTPVLKFKNVRGASLAKQLSIASDSSENPENSSSPRGKTGRDKPRVVNGRGAKEQQPQRTKLSRGRRAREVASKVSTPVLSKLDVVPSSITRQEFPEGDLSQLRRLSEAQMNPVDIALTVDRELDAVVYSVLPGGDVSDSPGAKGNPAVDDTRRRGIRRVRPRRGGRGKDLLSLDQNGVATVDLSNLSREELMDRLEFMSRTLMETEAKCERLEREIELQIDRSKALGNVTSEVQRIERIQELKYQKIEADLHENFRIVGLLESRLEEMLVKHTHLNRRSFASRFLWGTLDILTNVAVFAVQYLVVKPYSFLVTATQEGPNERLRN